jgi:hypothetical protein
MLILKERNKNLHQQILLPDFLIPPQFLNASMITNLSIVDDIAAVTEP